MEMTGQYLIDAPRDKVWEALNDPEVLKAAIPGCESLEKTEDNAFSAKVKAKVGPISAKFSGSVTLSDINAPESYTISGSGKGAAGGASGGAKVKLEEEGNSTRLSYEVEAKVNGKMAQLGGRLIDSAAKKMAGDFFGAFAEQLGGSSSPVEEGAAAEAPKTDSSQVEAAAAETAQAGTTPPAEDQAGTAADNAAAKTAEAETPDSSPADAAADAKPAESKAEESTAQTAATDEDAIKAKATEAATAVVKESRKNKSLSPAAWIVGLIALVTILLIFFGYSS
ncbi:SRPBCC family protein [Rhodovibrionaceae bacterium A322]